MQLNAPLHSGPDAVTATASGVEVVTLAPRAVRFATADDDEVYVCTSWLPADGSPPLYYGDRWTTDAETSCEDEGVDLLPLLDGAPSEGPDVPPRPVYPRGTATLSHGPGGFTQQYTGFDPPDAVWSCQRSGYAVTCEPPPPDADTYYVCGMTTVLVRVEAVGSVTGRGACASGPAAVATASSPAARVASGTARPRAAFPFRCAAAPDALALTLWSVQCTFGP